MTQTTTYKSFAPIEAGQLLVRMAETPREIELAQRLRFRIFCGELGAKANPEVMAQERDFDVFDEVCDHMLVIDTTKTGDASIIGTYRILRREHMRKVGRFYTESEFDITPLKNYEGEIMELGRSCVDVEYRGRAAMQLLWRGIGAYVVAYDVKIMFGCASLYGTDIEQHRAALSYLYHYHLAPEDLRIRALPDKYVEMNLIPKDQIDAKRTVMSLPPLMKGYLRVGAYVGEGAVIDPEYNTTDAGIIVKTELITGRYAERYTT